MSKIKVFDEHVLTGSESVESILNRTLKKRNNGKSRNQTDSDTKKSRQKD